MPLENPNVIDFLAFDAETNDVVLGITETRPWESSDERIQEVEEKVNAYLHFALDGHLAAQLPQLEGKSLRVQLDCVQEPDERLQNTFLLIQDAVQKHNVRFAYRVVPDLAEILKAHEAAQQKQGCCGTHEDCCGAHDHTTGETPEDCCGRHK